jgi:hypothetical protein
VANFEKALKQPFSREKEIIIEKSIFEKKRTNY